VQVADDPNEKIEGDVVDGRILVGYESLTKAIVPQR
jgi:hypothetical protein